jgi:predicted Zn-dependent protease
MLGVEVAARRGNAAEVDKAFSALQARHPNLPGTLITGGHIAMSRQQFAKAITAYRSAFEREPSSPLALLVSQAMLANKEADKALALLDGWSKRNPKDMTALRALAEVQVAAGKADAAKATYATVMAAQPDDPTVVAAYARLLQALKDPAATATAEKAYKMAPQNTALADGYGWMLVEKGDVDAGVRVLREARLRDPANPGLRWHLAAGLAKAGRKTEAREELQAALSANMPAPVGVDAARLKSEIGL